MIRSLAVSDLLVNVVMIVDCSQLLFITMINYNVICKVVKWLVTWASTNIGVFIWLIASDRHRKICKRFEKQSTASRVKVMRLAAVVFACVLPIRAFGTFDSVSIRVADDKTNHTSIYNYCTCTTEGRDLKTAVMVSMLLDCVITVLGWIYVSIAYAYILWTLCKLNSRSKARMCTVTISPRDRKLQDGQSCETLSIDSTKVSGRTLNDIQESSNK